MIGIEGTTSINGGRGRATLQCVWSIHRIDKQLGRLLDINSAWRDPREQETFYTAYRNYVNGNGPWAPIALPPEQSVHCKGEAIDTDDNNASMTRILNNNGWFHTVFRNGKLVEPWHYEYDYKRDKYFGAIPAGNDSTPFEEDMPLTQADVNLLLNSPAYTNGPTIARVLLEAHNVYDAIFKGGSSMDDAGRSISKTLANQTEFLDRNDKRVAALWDAVFSGGDSMPDGKNSIGQSLAEINKKLPKA